MKKYFKKSLSLFMAALMLMSCWVFFAPEAKAVDSGKYTWRVRGTSNNDTGGWDAGVLTVKGKSNNGKGSETTLYSRSGMYINWKETNKNWSGDQTSDSFPTYLSYYYKFGGGITHRKMDATLYIDVKNASGSWVEILSVRCYSYEWGRNEGTKEGSVETGKYPYANSVVFDKAPNDVTIPKTGTVNSTFRTHVNDQYGVRVASTASSYAKNVSLKSSRNSLQGYNWSWDSTQNGYDPGKVTVGNSAKLTAYDSNVISVTASYTFNGVTKTALKSFTATDPTYKFSFDGNGGTIAPNAAASDYYYNPIPADKIPSSGVKTGYEFIGMYKDARHNYAAAKPVAGETAGLTDNLKAGDKIDDDRTYYAAWWAKNVKVTFVDNMGNVVAETTVGKYDKTFANSATGLSVPTEVPFKSNKETGTFDYNFTGKWKVIDAKQYNADGTQSEYQQQYGADSGSFILKGDTVFQAVYEKSKKNYTVTFYNEKGDVEFSQSD